MTKLGLLVPLVLIASAGSVSLTDIQGGWWSSCEDPAVAFYVHDDEYSGDFEGSYKLSLTDDVLVFHDGLVDGHSIHVTRAPLSFQVMEATGGSLVLRPLSGNPRVGDWRLVSCEGGAS